MTNKQKPQRYHRVADEARALKAQVIVEIGTWNGDRAIEMVQAAFERVPGVTYYGFDLFEAMTPDKAKEEFNVKQPHTMSHVRHRLTTWARERKINATFCLQAGDTKNTLPAFLALVGSGIADLVWLDGGHSVSTIENDWTCCEKLVRPGGVVLFDDYYSDVPEDFLDQFGANRLVDRLAKAGYAVELLPEKDPVRGGGNVQIARVRI